MSKENVAKIKENQIHEEREIIFSIGEGYLLISQKFKKIEKHRVSVFPLKSVYIISVLSFFYHLSEIQYCKKVFFVMKEIPSFTNCEYCEELYVGLWIKISATEKNLDIFSFRSNQNNLKMTNILRHYSLKIYCISDK